jgi:hypothetical protein
MTFPIGTDLNTAAEAKDPVRGASTWYTCITFLGRTFIVIDVSCFLRVFGCDSDAQGRSDEERQLQEETHGNLLTSFYTLLAFLLDFKIFPVMTFEGKTPGAKEAEIDERRAKAQQAAREQASLLEAQRDLLELTRGQRLKLRAARAAGTKQPQQQPGRATLGPWWGCESGLRRAEAGMRQQLLVHRRNHFRPQRSAVDSLKELCMRMGLPFIQAAYEADWVADLLQRFGCISGVAGSDHDMLCHWVALIRDLQCEMRLWESRWFEANRERWQKADGGDTIRPSELPTRAPGVIRTVEIARPVRKGRKRKSRADADDDADDDEATSAPPTPYHVAGLVRFFQPTRVCELLELSRSQLIDLNIMMGSDYACPVTKKSGIKGVGFGKGVKLLHVHGSLLNILKQDPLPLPANAVIPCPTVEGFIRLVEHSHSIFMGEPDPATYPGVQQYPAWTQPVTAFDPQALEQFARDHCMLPPRRWSGLSCREPPKPPTAAASTTMDAAAAPWRYMYTLSDYARIRQDVWGECMAEMEGKLEFPPPSILDKLPAASSSPDVASARSSANFSLADPALAQPD